MLIRVATLCALALGLGAVAWLLTQEPPRPVEMPVTPDAVPRPVEKPPVTIPGTLPTPVTGGVVTGRVIGEGRPIAGATVLLVRYNAGDPLAIRRYREQLERDGVPDPTLIPTVGDFHVAGERRTDEQGAFAIAGGGDAYLSHVVAWHPGWFPEVLDLRDLPRNENGDYGPLDVTIERAGRVIGRVVDAETGEPVVRARVTMYLQQITRRVRPVEEGEFASTMNPTEEDPIPLSAMATLGRFVSQVLGPRVWGIPDSGALGFDVDTDANGRFEFGPLGPDVQIEFVVSHRDYAWTDMDNPDDRTQPVRTVVRPGETVEKTLRLRRGGTIAGRVIDNTTGKGVPGATIEVESLSGYFMHRYYKSKRRKTTTDDEGRFRVSGLSIGSQAVDAVHPSFGQVRKSPVEPGEANLVIGVDPFAGIRGTVTGVGERPPGGRVQLHVQRFAADGSLSAETEKRATLDAENRFLLTRVEPGRLRLWLQFGRLASMPQDVELRPLEVLDVEFALGGGGRIEGRVVDASGRIVDPAMLRLIAEGVPGEPTLGTFVTRAGELDVDGVVPGRYRFAVEAFGYVRAESEPFDVIEDRATRVELPRLERLGEFVIGPLLDETGRPWSGGGLATIEIRIGDENAPWKRHVGTLGLPRSVPPGPVAVRARIEGTTLAAEAAGVVQGGSTLRLDLRLRDGAR